MSANLAYGRQISRDIQRGETMALRDKQREERREAQQRQREEQQQQYETERRLAKRPHCAAWKRKTPAIRVTEHAASAETTGRSAIQRP